MSVLDFIPGGGAFKAIIGGVGGFLERRETRKQEERNHRAEMLKAGVDERANGWKDEFALIVVTAPFIAAFIPDAGPYIEKGFTVLKEATPDWYQYLLTGGLASALGLSVWKKTK